MVLAKASRMPLCIILINIMYIEEFIGVGEVAISDHRSSQPTVQQLAELAAEAKVAGMLSGKKGTVSIHVGPVDSQAVSHTACLGTCQ